MFLSEDPEHQWGKWDFRLVKALELRDEMVQGGVPIYWDRSDRVVFTAEAYVSKSRAALDKAEEKARNSKAKNYGKVFYPVPQTTDGGPMPTLEEWLEEQRAKKGTTAGYNPYAQVGGEFSNANWKPDSAPELD
jgi:hypothetical protein